MGPGLRAGDQGVQQLGLGGDANEILLEPVRSV